MSDTVQHTPMPLRIVQDSREQSPFRFDGLPAVVEVATLEAGDYSIRGFERRIAIERKSLPDLVACLGVERERFIRELCRLRGYDAAAVLVEAPANELRAGRYRAQLNPQSAWQTALAFTQRYRIPFLFCDSRANAEQVTFDLLRHFHHDRRRELAALTPPTPRHAGERAPARAMGGPGCRTRLRAS